MLQMNLIKKIKGLASKETAPPKGIKGISHQKYGRKEFKNHSRRCAETEQLRKEENREDEQNYKL